MRPASAIAARDGEWEILKYSPELRAAWESVVVASGHASILPHRDYLEYHGDRFEDFSVICYHDGVPVAVMPAHREGDTLRSHRGLTFGGLIVRQGVEPDIWKNVFAGLIRGLSACGLRRLYYSRAPEFYFSDGRQLDLHLLRRLGASLEARDFTSVISPGGFRLRASDRRYLRRCRDQGMTVVESDDFRLFWDEVLTPSLRSRHGVAPVHSLEEISYLKSKFPARIRLHTVRSEREILAGAVVYESRHVAHVQYSAATAAGLDRRALLFLFAELIQGSYPDRYFSFGTSVEPRTGEVNAGLLRSKQRFGATQWPQEVYRLELESATALSLR